MREAEIVRRLRDVYARGRDSGKFVFLSSPIQYVPEEINRELVVIDVPLPDHDELTEFVVGKHRAHRARHSRRDREARLPFAKALRGSDPRRGAPRATACRRGESSIDVSAIPELLEEKHLLVKKKTRVLEYIPHPIDLDQIGGVPYLKRWLLERRRFSRMRDDLSAISYPRVS